MSFEVFLLFLLLGLEFFLNEKLTHFLPLSPYMKQQQEKSPVFPAKTNVEFVQIHSHSHCKMRVWERGAGPTLACGTGACATVVAGVLEGKLERKCRVDLPGGPLFIEWVAEEGKEQGGVGGTVFMTGPAEWVFEGEVEVE